MRIGRLLCASLTAMTLAPGYAVAGPPLRTDDPGIVDQGHIELIPFHS